METRKRSRIVYPLHTEVKFSQEQLRTLYEFAGGLSAMECFVRMKKHLGDQAPNHSTLPRWKRKFDNGGFDVSDTQREGRPRISTDEQDVARVKALIEEDPCQAKRMAATLKMDATAVWRILTQDLGYTKKRAQIWKLETFILEFIAKDVCPRRYEHADLRDLRS
ncbi:unnamed protein product [Notodromas monacha]|uniref:Mos1 transposase HTH domain-containing protein n=1 Tax=Notodromas monacha TaxID=399045 RepID=A0A7R9BTW6_9CRUS|nr:unnamed protein product [Notodromas monacha]CAG0921342.1 unnamed protein product [Notodromas monacha]